ncbi:MAG TPA: c-type cytochrome [Casimicrobiaceae bacterium]|nr:c-type cytochrome [Casimicrobiaceae bacterium]
MDKPMKARPIARLAAPALAAAALLSAMPAFGADAAAAQALARDNKCFTCHAIDKDKAAPAWKAVAAKYKGNKDAVAILTKHLTTGPKVKLGGSEMDHPVLNSKSPDDTKNFVEWLLSL